MKTNITTEHWNDVNGNPEGGVAFGNGFAISWQHGPLGRHAADCVPDGTCAPGCTRRPPNGAFVEDVISAVIDRIQFYQSGKFACEANGSALVHLLMAAEKLAARTKDRQDRKVEGTHAA